MSGLESVAERDYGNRKNCGARKKEISQFYLPQHSPEKQRSEAQHSG